MSFFDIHESINKRAYQAFNVASDAAFRLRNVKSLLKDNQQFRNIHAGDRCFIVATGPSLNSVEKLHIDRLSGETVFGVNSLYKSEAVKHIFPKYYTMVDNLYWDKSCGEFEMVHSQYRESPPIFITDVRARQFIPSGAGSILIHAKHYPTGKMKYDLTGNISITMNVVGFSILAAMYMGFKEVYLLGCDYNLFCSQRGNHSYDDSSEFEDYTSPNLGFYLKYYHLTTEFHYLIARTAKADGIKIANLTDGSLLDAYPRRHVSDILR